MVISSSVRTMLWVFLASLVLCCPAFAQEASDYDPVYDDNEAAGKLEYSDQEAAGSTVAPEGEPSAEAELSTEGELSTSADTSGTMAWDGAEKSAEPTPSDRDKLDVWDWGAKRSHQNLLGDTGLLYTSQAGSDEGGTFALGVHGAFFYYTDYLIHGDENSYMWGAIKLRVTPVDFLEVFASIQSRANYNTKVNPKLFQALGDVGLGIKAFYDPVPWLSVGGLVGVQFMNPVGEVSFSLKGTSVPLMLLTTLDFAELNMSAPIRAHVNAGYFFDNSAKLIEGIEEQRGGCGTDEDNDGFVNFEGCLNSVERTALDIDRNDQITIGIGLDAAFPYISPMLEYVIEIPVNRQEFTCPQKIQGNPDSCMDVEGGAGMRQWLAFGVRILPAIDSLAIDIGVDLGLSGYAPSVHELSAQAPYRILFGASYNFDPFQETYTPPPPLPPPAPLPPPPLPPVVVGYIHDAANPDTAVVGATITYIGQAVNPQISERDGRFRSYPMSPGPLSIAIQAEGYDDASFAVEIPDSLSASALSQEAGTVQVAGDLPIEVQLDCPLTARPKKGKVLIRITDTEGSALSAVSYKLDGAKREAGNTDESGSAEIEIDEAGSYTVAIEKEGYFSKMTSVEGKLGETVELAVKLIVRPKRASVIVRKKRIVIKKKIHFETNASDIKSDSFPLMEEIAAVIQEHPELKSIEIQGHTDNRGKRNYNLDLSERRAASVRDYLMNAGVSSSRLEATGKGPDKPRAPNITKMGRAQNRRVEFHIRQKE